MQVNLLCPLCGPANATPFALDLAPKNDCLYEISCPCGHTVEANVLYHEFQKLFEVAVDALADNYMREAIGTFAASYERFLELFIRIVLTVDQVPPEQIEKTWKPLSRMSERQLGAFVVLYTRSFLETPPLLDKNLIELRNKVIHQGYFPTQDESMAYGTRVLASVRKIIVKIQSIEELGNELTRSLNDKGDFSRHGPTLTVYPYHLIATNRSAAEDVKPLSTMIEESRTRRHGIIKSGV